MSVVIVGGHDRMAVSYTHLDVYKRQYSFLVFNLLCAPCFAAMGAIKREMNNAKWFWFAIGYQTGLAYIVSLCIYQIGTWISTKVFGIGTAVAVVLIIGFMYLLLRPYKESKTLQVSMKNTVGAR